MTSRCSERAVSRLTRCEAVDDNFGDVERLGSDLHVDSEAVPAGPKFRTSLRIRCSAG